jgi:hypothetical protein
LPPLWKEGPHFALFVGLTEGENTYDLKRKMGEMSVLIHDPKDVVHLESPGEADEQWCEAFLTESADHLGSRVQLLSDAELRMRIAATLRQHFDLNEFCATGQDDKSPARYFLGMTKTRFRMVRMMPEAFLIFFDGRRPNYGQSHLMPEIVRSIRCCSQHWPPTTVRDRSLQPAAPRRVGVGWGARVGWSSLIAAALERLVCEETQERHHDPRRPAAAAASAGLTLAAWAIFHTLDDIK